MSGKEGFVDSFLGGGGDNSVRHYPQFIEGEPFILTGAAINNVNLGAVWSDSCADSSCVGCLKDRVGN